MFPYWDHASSKSNLSLFQNKKYAKWWMHFSVTAQIVQTNPVQGIKRPKTPQQDVTSSIANKLVRKILDDAADRIVEAKTATAALTAPPSR